MKIKTDNIEFISFKDGVCDIYEENEEGERVYKYNSLGFDKKVMGFNRYFTAAASQIRINAVIKVPMVSNVNNHDTLEIRNVGKYNIELIQEIYDTNPPSIDITLRQLEMFEVK